MSTPVQPVVHTPGPWRPGRADKSYDAGIPDNAFAVFAERQRQQDCCLQGNAAVICVIAKPERMTEEDIANAKLISSAPDMLQLIKDFAEWDREHPKSFIHSMKAERALDNLLERARQIVSEVV